jgi:hypothetical protein
MTARLEVVRFADVETKETAWLWPGLIPAGAFVLIDGDPGLGKSTLAADLAARVSTGRPMLDGSSGGAPRSAIFFSDEDDRSRTIRPRLEAAGADLARVFAVDAREPDGICLPAQIIPTNLEQLREIILAHDVALVVYDPLVAYMPDGLDTNRDANVRKVLSPLVRLAEETGCTILGLRHLRKSPSDNPLYRGGGSGAFIATARAAYLMAADPDEPEGGQRILAPTKMNLGPMPPAFAFRLVAGGANDFPHVEWAGSTHHTATSLSALLIVGRQGPARLRARDFLAEQLADGPVATAEIERRAAEQGISTRTLDRARSELGVKPRKLGQPDEPGPWLLCLPKDANSGRRTPTAQVGTLRGNLALFDADEASVDAEQVLA